MLVRSKRIYIYNVGAGSIKFFHYVIDVINFASSLTASYSSYCALPREMLRTTEVGYEQKKEQTLALCSCLTFAYLVKFLSKMPL